MEEIWKDIKGLEGLYQVSSCGNVATIRSGKKKLMKPYLNNKGYKCVDFRINGTRFRFLVSRLVAQNFLQQEVGKIYVDHIDGNPLNNSVDNLRWCTHKENCNYPIAIERKKAAQKEIHSREGWRKKKSEATKKQMSNPVNKESLRRKIKEKWKDPEFLKVQRERDCMNKRVMQFSKDGIFVNEYISLKEAQRETGIDAASIGRCCVCKQKTAGGYIWKSK